ARAQQDSAPVQPYATINRAAINYAGPDREAARDLVGPEIKIGILAPLQGPRQREGEALLAAARMAIEDESAAPLSDGRHLALAVRDETGLWGRASSELVKLVVENRAVALITSPDGRAAHLSEQVGNRLGVPVLTLASDSTSTQINIPWMFRVVSSDAAQARLFAGDIYGTRALERVLLVTEGDHDGKVGREEFAKAAQRLNASVPTAFEIPAPGSAADTVAAQIRSTRPQAIVVWASAEAAARVFAALRGSNAEFYVCHKALQEPFLSVAREVNTARLWTASASGSSAADSRREFDRRFRARSGTPATPAAREMYDAVRLIAARLRESGPNRARLRDALAARGEYRGVSGTISFDGAGNNQAEVTIGQFK
ncbi:MAG: ABC transporter substrate-binding protein, partial [Burkholderiales bacterium]